MEYYYLECWYCVVFQTTQEVFKAVLREDSEDVSLSKEAPLEKYRGWGETSSEPLREILCWNRIVYSLPITLRELSQEAYASLPRLLSILWALLSCCFSLLFQIIFNLEVCETRIHCVLQDLALGRVLQSFLCDGVQNSEKRLWFILKQMAIYSHFQTTLFKPWEQEHAADGVCYLTPYDFEHIVHYWAAQNMVAWLYRSRKLFSTECAKCFYCITH